MHNRPSEWRAGDLPFRIEIWNDRATLIDRFAAATDNVLVGHAAFDAVVARYPDKAITLRHGARVIKASAAFRAAEEREEMERKPPRVP